VNLRSPLEATVVVLIVIVGLLAGGMIAFFSRASAQRTETVSVAQPAARAQTPPAPALTPAARVTTPLPTATPPATATPAATATPRATTAPANLRVAAPRSGAWRIEEANVQVGTIVWSGAGTASDGGNALVLEVRKASVAGHAVSACERATRLRAVVNAGASAQTVRYQEVNCSGATMSGEMRVSRFSADGLSFTGSFWSGGVKLGDFVAMRT
jgi:hypothetical protein